MTMLFERGGHQFETAFARHPDYLFRLYRTGFPEGHVEFFNTPAEREAALDNLARRFSTPSEREHAPERLARIRKAA